MSQYTLNFEPALPERFPTLRAFVAHRSVMVSKSAKVVAADMDMAPSTLSRKLNPGEGDTQRFNCDDLEGWIASTGDASAVIEYLAAKFLDSDDQRRQRAIANLERLQKQMVEALASMREVA